MNNLLNLLDTPGGSLVRPLGPGVDELAVRVYEYTLGNGPVSTLEAASALRVPAADAERAMDTLRDLRLVSCAGSAAGYRAVSPDAAQIELVMPLEQAIHDKRRELAGIHEQLRSFVDTFSTLSRSRPRQEEVVRHQDPRQVQLRMAAALRGCGTEVLAMRSLGNGLAPEGEPFDLPVGVRGIPVRLLYPHPARTCATVRAGLRRAAQHGARIRTSNHVFEDLVLIGDDVAFLPDQAFGQDVPTVTVVYEPAIVALLRRFYDYAWQAGADFEAEDVSYGDTLGDVRATILDLLASGLKDDVVARRIGMSSRTFRRHISSIMDELGADSRFQAGVAAARAGLVGTEESDPGLRRAG
ncbi:helix-turn-helix transcriptional regulator [Kitasatospora mediocidica]|uniref:helix-turn-helix transcriptional regulator n=1 Tax=Kitasatospora mediocidica TaxID=58352 RepID=UPI00068CFDBB|nr:response regulator transcription factor [Kitasatospora mediocidica]